MITLSICIATYNRAAFIGETLESILSQVSDEVEVLVADGASTDNTSEILAGFTARCPQLRFVQLGKKGGFDHDYAKAVEFARGTYCWLFTDDDLMKPGAVAAVLQAIRQDYSLIVVNAEVRDVKLDVCLQGHRIALEADLVFADSQEDRDRFLSLAGDYLSFIGAVVIKREIWNQRDKALYFGTYFGYLGVTLGTPMPGKTLVMARPWIQIRYGNAQWVSKSFEIWMFKWPDLIWSFPHFSDWAKQRVVARKPWLSWPRLGFERALGHYTFQDYSTWLAPRLRPSLNKMVLWAIARTPVGCLNLLARFCARHILRKVPSIGLYDLEAWQPPTRR